MPSRSLKNHRLFSGSGVSNSTLPKSFLPGATAKLCLVYLVPKGRALQSVDLQTGSAKDAITWTP